MNDRTDVQNVRSALAYPRQVAAALGMKAKIEGAGVKVCCPAHGEKTPSCSLTRGPDGTLRVRCFGCELSGDIFSLVAAVERLDLGRDFPEVLKAAARLGGVTIVDRASRGNDYVPIRLPPPPPPDLGPPPLEDELFHELIAQVLHTGRLDRSPIAADVTAYLEARGLLELAIEDGWAALPVPACQGVIVQAMRDVHGDDVVMRSGLVYVPDPEDGPPNWTRFVHAEARILIPWRTSAGVVQTLQRRRLDAGDAKRPKYVFAKGRQPSSPYGSHRLHEATDYSAVAFCEGAPDVLALREIQRRSGVPVIVLGVPGVSAWKERGAAWSAVAAGRVAAVALDDDKAGRAHVDAMLADLQRAGAADVQTWTPCGGAKDWAEQLNPVVVLKAVA